MKRVVFLTAGIMLGSACGPPKDTGPLTGEQKVFLQELFDTRIDNVEAAAFMAEYADKVAIDGVDSKSRNGIKFAKHIRDSFTDLEIALEDKRIVIANDAFLDDAEAGRGYTVTASLVDRIGSGMENDYIVVNPYILDDAVYEWNIRKDEFSSNDELAYLHDVAPLSLDIDVLLHECAHQWGEHSDDLVEARIADVSRDKRISIALREGDVAEALGHFVHTEITMSGSVRSSLNQYIANPDNIDLGSSEEIAEAVIQDGFSSSIEERLQLYGVSDDAARAVVLTVHAESLQKSYEDGLELREDNKRSESQNERQRMRPRLF